MDPIEDRKQGRGREAQQALLAGITNRVQQQAMLMQKAIDDGNPKDALKYASAMLHEMRTGALAPKTYFELYMQIFDHLMLLEMFFEQLQGAGTPVRDLYEMVQHAGSVLTRLYLMITVGSVFIKSKELPAHEILNDLLDMSKGVQHPTRGLFLRYYLFQKTQDKLPESGSEYEGFGGTIDQAVKFAMYNFIEMNKLWVRMQHSNDVRNRKRRGKERRELRTIIGTAIDRIGSIEGITVDMFAETVLPELLTQVKNCNDRIAQQFLMDSITQVFPVPFHIRTLRTYLSSAWDLLPEVDVEAVLVGHVRRITDACNWSKKKGTVRSIDYSSIDPTSEYSQSLPIDMNSEMAKKGLDTNGIRVASFFPSCCSDIIPDDVDCFNAFFIYVQRAIVHRLHTAPLPPLTIVHMCESLLVLVGVAYPGCVEYVDNVLQVCSLALQKSNEPIDFDTSKAVESLIAAVVNALSLSTALGMSGVSALMNRVGFAHRRAIATYFLQYAQGEITSDADTAMNNTTTTTATSKKSSKTRLMLDSPEAATNLCEKISPLLSEDDEIPPQASQIAFATVGLAGDLPTVKAAVSSVISTPETQMFLREQRLVASIVNLLPIPTPTAAKSDKTCTDNVFAIIKTLRQAFGTSGPIRISYTLPALIMGALRLARTTEIRERMTQPSTDQTDHDKDESQNDAAKDDDAKDDEAKDETTENEDDVTTNDTNEEKASNASQSKDKKSNKHVKNAHQKSETLQAKNGPEMSSKKIFQFIYRMCDALKEYGELCIKLFCEAGIIAAGSGFCYEFISAALTVYEDLVDSRIQRRCAETLISTLYACKQHGLPEETYEHLAMVVKKHAIRQLRRQDQCRLAAAAARMFWVMPVSPEMSQSSFDANVAKYDTSIGIGAAYDQEPLYANGEQTLKCLQLALRSADSCIPADHSLFVHVLDAYIYYFERGVPTVTSSHLRDLATVIRENLAASDATEERTIVNQYFDRIVSAVERKKQTDAGKDLFADVKL